MFTFLHLTLIELGSVTGVREGPGSINEDHVRRQQHYEDAVGEGDQAAVPLRSSLGERPAEQQVETQPANQAADHFQNCHGRLHGKKKRS